MTNETPILTAEPETAELLLTSRMALQKLESAARIILDEIELKRKFPERLNHHAGMILADAMLLHAVLEDWRECIGYDPSDPKNNELPLLKALQYHVDLAEDGEE